MTNNNGTDCGGLRDEALTRFSNNFMRILCNKYPNSFVLLNNAYYTVKLNTSAEDYSSSITEFLLGNIFIMIMSGRCASNIDPTLQASIFNYSCKLPLEFYGKYESVYEYLNQQSMKSFIESCINNSEVDIPRVDLGEDGMSNLQTPSHILLYFCNFMHMDYEVVNDQLKAGTFVSNSKKHFYEQSIDAANYLLQHYFKTTLSSLNILPYEFCQMVNYDAVPEKLYWQHFEKINNIVSLVKCFNDRTEREYNT